MARLIDFGGLNKGLFYEIPSKISPWPCWCWGSPGRWGWPQNSGPRVRIKNHRVPHWSAWKTEGVGCAKVHLSLKLAVGGRDRCAFLSRYQNRGSRNGWKTKVPVFFISTYISTYPTEQCSNTALKIYFHYVSCLRTSQLFTVLTGVNFQILKLTVLGMETIYKSWVERALNSGPFGHFRFANHHYNCRSWSVWTFVIGSSCLIRTILEYEKVR